ncbi:FLJ37770-like protein [Trichonephila clavipes]|nr:FLJ37770-like protein [Trichonephila clavipes]
MSIVHSDGLGEFQQENMTPHTSRIATEWLREHSSEFRHFRWPPKSPDMNINEYIWNTLQRAVQKRSPPLLTPTDLWTALHDSWYDRQDVEDDSRPVRPSTSKTDENVEKVASLIRSDCRLSIRAIAETVNIDKECVRQILHDNLNMQKVCAKMVPKILTFEQQATRKNVCTDNLDAIKNDPNLLEKVIT